MLSGRPPFQAETPLDTLLQVLEQEPEPPRRLNPKVDRDLETICLKCLEKEPKKRYASAAALADDLGRFLEGEAVRARPLGEWESAVRWAKRHPITAVLTALMVIGTILLQLFYTALGFVPEFGPQEGLGTIMLASAAWLGGFLATMAILVHPRRWVVSGAVLFLLVTLGLPCVLQENLKPSVHRNVVSSEPGIPVLILGLGVGVLLAGLFGGTSRWIARRHETDMLSVFFGGVLGAMCPTACPWCLFQSILYMLFEGPSIDRTAIGVVIGVMFIGSLVGFWLGGTFIARINRRRLGSG
jgi:hypothetical protein